jgi:hypothetical protein
LTNPNDDHGCASEAFEQQGTNTDQPSRFLDLSARSKSTQSDIDSVSAAEDRSDVDVERIEGAVGVVEVCECISGDVTNVRLSTVGGADLDCAGTGGVAERRSRVLDDAVVEVEGDVLEGSALGRGGDGRAVEDVRSRCCCGGIVCFVLIADLQQLFAGRLGVLAFSDIDLVLERVEGSDAVAERNDVPREHAGFAAVSVDADFVTRVAEKKSDNQESEGDETVDDCDEDHTAAVEEGEESADLAPREDSVEGEEDDGDDTDDDGNGLGHVDVAGEVFLTLVERSAEVGSLVGGVSEVGSGQGRDVRTVSKSDVSTDGFDLVVDVSGERSDIVEDTLVGRLDGVSTTEKNGHGSDAENKEDPGSPDGELDATRIVVLLLYFFVDFIPGATTTEVTRASVVGAETATNVTADCDERAENDDEDDNDEGDDDSGEIAHAGGISKEILEMLGISEASSGRVVLAWTIPELFTFEGGIDSSSNSKEKSDCRRSNSNEIHFVLIFFNK